ncbi:hypothetical protein D3C81_2021030 [compost metagenome]
MAGVAVTDPLVAGGVGTAAGIAGDRALDPFDMLEHPLHAPEATAGEHRGLFACLAGGLVQRWRGQGDRGLTERPGGALPDHSQGQQAGTQRTQSFHEPCS